MVPRNKSTGQHNIPEGGHEKEWSDRARVVNTDDEGIISGSANQSNVPEEDVEEKSPKIKDENNNY